MCVYVYVFMCLCVCVCVCVCVFSAIWCVYVFLRVFTYTVRSRSVRDHTFKYLIKFSISVHEGV